MHKGRVFDFHSLRVQYISGLARAGVPEKVAQTLARHSSITLTFDTYAKVQTDDLTHAVNKLPAVPLTQNLTQTGVPKRQHVARTDKGGEVAPVKGMSQKALSKQDLARGGTRCREKSKRGAGGSRTHGGGFAIRCLSHLATAPRISRKSAETLVLSG